MTKFCKRKSDGAIYPFTEMRAAKENFEVVEIDTDPPDAPPENEDDGAGDDPAPDGAEAVKPAARAARRAAKE